MQFMLIMRDEDQAAIDRRDGPFEEMLARMGAFNAELQAAGALVTAQGLAGPETGVVVDFSATPPLITDGPYGETKELFNGFWVIEAEDQAAAQAEVQRDAGARRAGGPCRQQRRRSRPESSPLPTHANYLPNLLAQVRKQSRRYRRRHE